MEVGKMSRLVSATKYKNDDGDDVPLPGFRFHPTDEELVGFYLRRKIEKKTLRIQQLIKQVDIYKYDPWDLPMNMHSEGGNTGDKEGYFFCKRGRKYKNSVRPNRVTGSGFWKATGIDKPIYSTTGGGREAGESRDCIGLKKSLVYYRGSAGKGTKTDWMMHEFRLPTDHDLDHHKSTKHIRVINVADQDAEVWTLCRILKRKASHGKYVPDWREMSFKRKPSDESFETCSSVEVVERHENYNNIGTLENHRNEKKQLVNDHVGKTNQMLSNSIISQAPSSSLSLFSPQVNEFIKYGDWDELRSVVEFAFDPLFW